MTTKNSPAVVVMCKGSSSNRGFTKYVTREEALKQSKEEAEGFFRYATNEQKTQYQGIFNKDKIGLTEEEKQEFIDRSAELINRSKDEEKLYMFKDVVSFDNEYLKEHHLIDSNNQVDVRGISRLVQRAYERHALELGMSKDYQLLGAIHLNTDNVHVHVGLADHKYNERYYRSQKSIKAIKRSITTDINNEQRQTLFKEIDLDRKTLREKILKDIKPKFSPQDPNEKLLKEIIKELPQDQKLWRMKSNAVSMKQPKVLVKEYIDKELEKSHSKAFNDFKEKLKQDEKYNQRLYGKSEANQTYKKKLDRFYEETGNKIFKTIKELKKEETTRENKNQSHQRYDVSHGRFERFNKGNQQRIKEVVKNPSLILNREEWKRVGGQIDLKAKPIQLMKVKNGRITFESAWDISQLKNKEAMRDKFSVHEANKTEFTHEKQNKPNYSSNSHEDKVTPNNSKSTRESIGDYRRYSPKNQELIKEAIDNPSVVFTKNQWEALGGKIDSQTIPITIVQFNKSTRSFDDLKVYDISQLSNKTQMSDKIKTLNTQYKSHADFVKNNKEFSNANSKNEKQNNLANARKEIGQSIQSGFMKLMNTVNKSSVSARHIEHKRQLTIEEAYEQER
ncbi:relaxase MobL [Lactococcus lactis]|uniref:relaxase MobL n=1 Tax=Lactococcus lactis TaxID=1358 RepID=UPI0025A1D7E2|nr:relaxase MobL [Lactococcus lactis]MDM7644491.1 relaxase MobL [Lactococcus lactis]